MNMMKGSRNVKGVDEWSKAGTFLRKPENGWLHSAQNIKDGVCYALKVGPALFFLFFEWWIMSALENSELTDCEFRGNSRRSFAGYNFNMQSLWLLSHSRIYRVLSIVSVVLQGIVLC